MMRLETPATLRTNIQCADHLEGRVLMLLMLLKSVLASCCLQKTHQDSPGSEGAERAEKEGRYWSSSGSGNTRTKDEADDGGKAERTAARKRKKFEVQQL